MGRKGAIVAVVIMAIAVGIAIALLQPRPEVQPDDGVTVIANATEPEGIVSVASARSAFPFVQRWVSQYNNDENALGSVEIGYYLDGPNTPSDLTIVGDVRHAANGSHNIPVSAQAVTLVYNIPSFPDIPSGMKFNSSLLSSILNGSITRWDDPAIRDLNRDLNLPAERIIVIHEKGNSSSLALLEGYLSTDMNWPDNSLSVLGPDELASMVRKTPYSIGYVDFSYATQTRMTFAALANPNGEYVLPSTGSIGQAVNSSIQVQNVTRTNQTAVLTPPFMNASVLGNSSYPLTGLYYASLPDNASNATMAFVKWMIEADKGQQILSEVQYPAIYQDNEPLKMYAEAAINRTGTK